jgi:hypothetical protein
MADEIEIREAPEVRLIALELIRDFHPHLAEASIRYLRSTQDKTYKGKVVAAEMRSFNKLQRYLASGTAGEIEEGEEYYLMVYEGFGLYDATQRRAAIDHELCHLYVKSIDEVTGEEKLGWRDHDVQEFSDVIERHGLWNQDVREFAAKARQLSLDGLMRTSTDVARTMRDELAAEGLTATFSAPGRELVTLGAER